MPTYAFRFADPAGGLPYIVPASSVKKAVEMLAMIGVTGAVPPKEHTYALHRDPPPWEKDEWLKHSPQPA